jgi:hypothetical protein
MKVYVLYKDWDEGYSTPLEITTSAERAVAWEAEDGRNCSDEFELDVERTVLTTNY